MTNEKDNHKCIREELCNFKNWPQWADFTQAMLEEKEVSDKVDKSRADSITVAQSRIKK